VQNPHLIIIPSVPVWKNEDNLVFDRKFYDGIALYTRKWDGKITCIMQTSSANLPDFGAVGIKRDDLPFSCIPLAENELVTEDHIKGAALVLASGDAHDQLHISALCRKTGSKCVYVIEYIPETRYQIAFLSTKNPLIRFRRYFYIWFNEKKRIAAFRLSDGLQSNGTPAYYEYSKIDNNLLYFDTRVDKKNNISDGDLKKRLATLPEGKPLRLAFSGRLILMKGADHLVRLALMLRDAGNPFHLVIYGVGDLESEMREYIESNGLESQVSMPGAVDFYTRLIPDIQEKVDLFVCLHRQSDPSCTYLETLSCGVPIVGYENRAFAGLLGLADIGWGASLDDLDGIAAVIRHLDSHREELAEKSVKSAEFARLHDFETTFQKRITHLRSLL
jgi:colanic acid/amylovoran biosynthesis glycosyltransferase